MFACRRHQPLPHRPTWEFGTSRWNGLNGRHSGSVPNFKYTKDYTDPGLVWNKETFGKYIKNPRAMFPDTTMIFPGIQDAQQIDDLWAYLSQYDADGNVKK